MARVSQYTNPSTDPAVVSGWSPPAPGRCATGAAVLWLVVAGGVCPTRCAHPAVLNKTVSKKHEGNRVRMSGSPPNHVTNTVDLVVGQKKRNLKAGDTLNVSISMSCNGRMTRRDGDRKVEILRVGLVS